MRPSLLDRRSHLNQEMLPDLVKVRGDGKQRRRCSGHLGAMASKDVGTTTNRASPRRVPVSMIRKAWRLALRIAPGCLLSLTLATMVMWPATLSRTRTWYLPTGPMGDCTVLIFDDGRLTVADWTTPSPPGVSPETWFPRPTAWPHWGGGHAFTYVQSPLWMIALAFGMAAVAVLLVRPFLQFHGAGACCSCGYARTGLAADAPCPECGTASPT